MISVKSILLERFNIAFSKRTEQKKQSNSGSVKPIQPGVNFETLEASYLSHARNQECTQRLEQRIAGLEQQNDQLVYFINFLLENLPELIQNILESETGLKSVSCSEMDGEDCARPECCAAISQPRPTRREQDVLELLTKGLCAKEIAHRLFISESTVITHKKNLKEKFNARNTVELISKAQPHLP